MLIDIKANKDLQVYYLQDINDNKIKFTVGEEFDLPYYGWYKLVIEYPGSKLKIEDISLNSSSLHDTNRLLYTGWFKEQSDKRTNPGTILYTKGQFELWIHSNIGAMSQRLLENIRMDHFTTNLFELYDHTVDLPIHISDDYPELIRGFFSHSNGPNWWRKNSVDTPYETLDSSILQDINKSKLHEEMKAMCGFNKDSKSYAFPKKGQPIKGGRQCYRSSPYDEVEPWTEIEDLPGEELQRLCKILGFKRMGGVVLQTQYPGETFAPHADIHTEQHTKQYLQGPCSFILDLAPDTTGHYFKVSHGGLLNVDHGVFFNFNYAHATYNDSDTIRPLCILFGERDNELNWYLNN